MQNAGGLAGIEDSLHLTASNISPLVASFATHARTHARTHALFRRSAVAFFCEVSEHRAIKSFYWRSEDSL